LLLRGDQLGANQLIRGLLDAGTPIIDVYLGIFQPALREAGALWARNQISVEDEHYVSAATQLIMAQIYPMVPSKKRVGRKALLACVEGELHDIGLRMVADLFEMNGWDGLFLGAGTAIDSIPTVIEKHRPDILLLSAAIDANLPAARETILKVRRRPREISPPIMVGGCLFNQHAGLWREIGADAYSRITKEVVPAAENLRSIRRSKP
jgi:methanogenic corrinoid protein MtbC1